MDEQWVSFANNGSSEIETNELGLQNYSMLPNERLFAVTE
jgi:hypothetical protein